MRWSQHRALMAAAVAATVINLTPALLAQPPDGKRPRAPMYETATETTLTGTIEAIEEVTCTGCMGRRSVGGTHVTLKTATETIEVHLGPTAYLAEKKAKFAKGDTVAIRGSRVTIGDEAVLLAREIKKGDQRWTLRDASGRPLWRGGRS
jgi:hypothetical protein